MNAGTDMMKQTRWGLVLASLLFLSSFTPGVNSLLLKLFGFKIFSTTILGLSLVFNIGMFIGLIMLILSIGIALRWW